MTPIGRADRVLMLIVAALFAALSAWLGPSTAVKAPPAKPAGSTTAVRPGI